MNSEKPPATQAETTTYGGRFVEVASLGYGHRLLPIVPPNADLNPNSALAKRKGHNDPRGKAVGVKGRDGTWHGLDWISYTADEEDHQRWQRMGAGIGIKTGDGLVAIDADTLEEAHAATIRNVMRTYIDAPPIRVGRYPKALYLCRVSEPYRYTRVEFGGGPGKPERVEILSDGRQFVAHGIHPATLKPYHWPRPLVHFDHLPTVSAETLDNLMQALREALPASTAVVKEGSAATGTEVNQEALRGSLEHVKAAARAIPNTSEHFPTREGYLQLGYAIKAALPDHPNEAFDIFADWCARWQDGENDPGTIEADWRRMKPPFRRGAGWLYEQAERLNPKEFTAANVWFSEIPETDNPFDKIELNLLKENTDTYPLLTIVDLVKRPPPVWLVDRHVPQQSVGFLYSEPGAGKTFIALDMALSIACALPSWHGDAIHAGENPAVIYIASEGSFDLRNRVLAWLKARERPAPAGFLLIEQTINFMNAEDMGRLLRTIRGVVGMRTVLVVVDTVSRALPGADENLQKDMTIFVRSCDAVKEAFQCAVLGIHHAGKSGDMRGSTVLLGAGDYVFRLTRKHGATIGTLHCDKMKAAPDGWEEPYRFETISLGDGQSSLVVARADMTIGPSVALTPDVSAAVLSAMSKAWDDGRPWSKSPQAKDRYAVRFMVRDHGFTAEKAEDILSTWEATGIIRHETISAKHRIAGYSVAGGAGQAVHNEGIFG
jgi:hypothetical protein